MSGTDRNGPPLPRDHDEVTFSELVPIRSTKINLLKSPLLVFLVGTALATVYLFAQMGAIQSISTIGDAMRVFTNISLVVTCYLLAMVILAVHLYSRTDKPVYYYVFPIAVSALWLTTPAFSYVAYIFRDVLPGNKAMMDSPNFVTSFIGYFFAAGLLEELVKGSAALIGAALTLRALEIRKSIPPFLYNLIRVRSPLDGVLMGIGAGAGFIILETVYEYVPRTFQQTLHGNDMKDVMASIGYGMLLLLPRVINGLAGHMGYAGVFGYFIGLAVLRPSQKWKLIGIGWAAAAVLHGFWDSASALGAGAFYVSALISAVLLLACLLKARQLEASIFGRSAITTGSIVVGAANAPRPAAAAAAASPVAAPAAAPPVPKPATATAAGLALAMGGKLVKLLPGSPVDLGGGITGEVIRHPTNPDVVGLRNLGATTWQARLRDNSVQPIEPQKNLRLAVGVSIDFGGGLTAEVVQG